MALKGDEDQIKTDFYDSFLPDGITIYLDDGVTEDEEATSSAENSVRDMTDAMANAVIDYVDSALDAGTYMTALEIDDRIAEVDSGIPGTTLEEKFGRIDDIQVWTYKALRFFGGAEHEIWDETDLAGSGWFDYYKQLRADDTLPDEDAASDINNIWHNHMGDWPDIDI